MGPRDRHDALYNSISGQYPRFPRRDGLELMESRSVMLDCGPQFNRMRLVISGPYFGNGVRLYSVLSHANSGL